jgi:photosystem II stability/assembly factor-like uncharacterized protein
LIVLALIVIAAASLAYLKTSPSSNSRVATPTINPPQVSKEGDSVLYDFVTPSEGWALVIRAPLPVGRGQFWVYRTIDSAKHWQEQLRREGNLVEFGLDWIQFFDKAHGLIRVASMPDIVYRTADGGAHWSVVGLPGAGGGVVAFSDPSNGWLFLSLGPPTYQSANLYRTSDGGNSWQRLPDPPADVVDSVTFRGPSEGWSGSRGDPLPHVYSSNDGGRNWHRHDLPVPAFGLPAGAIADVRLLPGVGVFALLDSGSGAVYMLTSFDGGSSWTSVQSRPSGNGFFGVVDFEDAFHWWAIDGWILYKSADAGQTWIQVSDHLSSAYQYIPHVLDSKHAWALVLYTVGTGLTLTSDGGLHWTRVNVPQPA